MICVFGDEREPWHRFSLCYEGSILVQFVDRRQTMAEHRRRKIFVGTWGLGLLSFLALLIFTASLAADPPDDDKVIRLAVTLNSGQVAQGTVTDYDDIGFVLTDGQGQNHRIMWTSVPIDSFDRYWRFLEEPEGDAQALFHLGVLLSRHRDGETLAAQAFDEAVALDEGLAGEVERIERDGLPGEGPRFIGTVDETMWGELSDELMAQSADQLKAYCQQAQQALGLDLRVYESPRFIICTDVDEQHVTRWGTKLTEAYRRIAELLGENPDGNIFKGKCLVFVFDSRQSYYQFQLEMHETDAVGTGGLCHGFGDGSVHVALHRRVANRQTTHVLVHEFVHAYLHRYRAPVALPGWINEGLATAIAYEVEAPAGQGLYGRALVRLEGEIGLGENFYEGEHLRQWQYDVAGALSMYLLERNEDACANLIDALKDGEDTEAALESAYRMESRVLTQRFKRRLDRDLQDRLNGR